MPLAFATTIVMALPTQKPRIGFSIESIVGSQKRPPKSPPPHYSPANSESSERPLSPLSDSSFPADAHSLLFRGHPPTGADGGHLRHLPQQRPYPHPQQQQRQFHPADDRISRGSTGRSPPLELHVRSVADVNGRCLAECPRSPDEQEHSENRQRRSALRMIDLSSNSSRSPPPPAQTLLPADPEQTRRHHRSPLGAASPGPPPHPTTRGPIMVPGVPAGLVRPFPMGHGPGELKSLPPFMGNSAAEMAVQAAHNQHFLAAQFQAAAALAHVQAHGQGGFHGHPAHLHSHHPANIPRDSYPLYPWLLTRHGRNVFPPRFPGNYLLPFRKPKRVRTAFSPSQLLKLEHSFENNHYVVGAERKTLAQALGLTETQVKVWFQNRRTKHKRMQQEEDAKSGGNGDSGSGGGQRSSGSPGGNYEDDEDEELIDMEMDDECVSDEDDQERG